MMLDDAFAPAMTTLALVVLRGETLQGASVETMLFVAGFPRPDSYLPDSHLAHGGLRVITEINPAQESQHDRK